MEYKLIKGSNILLLLSLSLLSMRGGFEYMGLVRPELKVPLKLLIGH